MQNGRGLKKMLDKFRMPASIKCQMSLSAAATYRHLTALCGALQQALSCREQEAKYQPYI
jgi:hypothetical protein